MSSSERRDPRGGRGATPAGRRLSVVGASLLLREDDVGDEHVDGADLEAGGALDLLGDRLAAGLGDGRHAGAERDAHGDVDVDAAVAQVDADAGRALVAAQTGQGAGAAAAERVDALDAGARLVGHLGHHVVGDRDTADRGLAL